MSQARVLYDLQQIDTEIRTKKQRLGEVLRLQKEPPALVAAFPTRVPDALQPGTTSGLSE